MLLRILQLLKPQKPEAEILLSLVLDPAKAAHASGVRHRLVIGGKVIDLTHEANNRMKGPLL